MTAQQMQALIADDQPDVVEALRLLLKREGYQIETVHSPDAVLKNVSARRFDVLLMDLNYARDTTSGQEGLDLLGRIRKMDAGLPVIVMTAWASIPVAVEAMRRGARDFVEKPWDNSRLLATVRRQIRCGSARATVRDEWRDAVAAQQHLLPRRVPEIPGCDFASAWAPAGQVGGDYLDVIPLESGRVGIAVGDVAGKGLAAALLMSNLQAAVRALAPEAASPAELATRVNRIVSSNLPANRFVTMFYGVLEGKRLRYTNAGHNPPVLVRADGTHQRLSVGGTVMGVFPDCTFEQAEVELQPGDRLVLFSDGVVEAEDRDGNEFGEDRLVHIVTANRTLDAASLRRKVMAAVEQFTEGALRDDTTLLVCVFDGSAPRRD